MHKCDIQQEAALTVYIKLLGLLTINFSIVFYC